MNDKEIIQYYEIQEERMGKEIQRLNAVITQKNKYIEGLEKAENIKKLKMDGFDDCIEGVVERFGQIEILCYNKEKVIEKLMKEGDRTYTEALEYYEFNQLGAWVGEGTPCFLDKQIDLKEWNQ
jgi:hypothetical protein